MEEGEEIDLDGGFGILGLGFREDQLFHSVMYSCRISIGGELCDISEA